MKRLFWIPLMAAALANADPIIVYSKSFPGSTPAFVLIELKRDGQAVYKEAVDDENPAHFKLAKEDVEEVFALAEKVDKLKRTLESGLKVAFMGDKTLKWVDGATVNEQKFNYTQDLDGNKLYDWFEKMTQSEFLYFQLERAVKFDKLGVHKAILQVEAAWDKKRLVAVDQFLPLLDRVAKNSSYLNMARERAAYLAETLRAPKPAPPAGAN